ncbi:MAG: efflux RND transporter permease subunit [Melioribacteraceae bacterium]|nr:efflux RND transporter permease subunit [Melioribacteraceae bacterium]MCF8264910.1 efflux RND transporter permease subunit [Melioribacteraceae bacterium]MCF8430730.1 efflux RND transporter permease subunit [Melioribacteraceae bacterium]
MKRVFYTVLSRPITLFVIYFTVLIIGITSLFNLPLELSPDISLPKFTINTFWFGVEPETIEAEVTSVIESEIASIVGIKEIISTTSYGLSTIDITFNSKENIEFKRVELGEKISALHKTLPVGITPPRITDYVPEELKDLQGFITYSVSSKRNQSEIRKILKEKVLYQISSLNGVSDVTITGGTDRLIEILIDPDKMKKFAITLDEIQNALATSNKIESGGKIESNGTLRLVTLNNTFLNSSVIENLKIKIFSSGGSLKLKDIAHVVDGYKQPNTYYRINGRETVNIIISKEAGANTLEVAANVFEKIRKLKNELPSDFQFTKDIDRSENIRDELTELSDNAIYSIILLALILLLVFRKYKLTIVVLISLLFSILFALILFFVFEISLNILTISAFILGFGFMVDNSIVVIEYLERNQHEQNRFRNAILLRQILPPVFAATLTTLAVFIPLLFLTGELKVYFIQFAKGVIFTLLASFLVSFSLIPLLYQKFFRQSSKEQRNYISFPQKIYSKIIFYFHKKIKTTATICLLLVGLPVWLLPDEIETPVLKEVYNPVFSSDIFYDLRPYLNYAFGGASYLFFEKINRGEYWLYNEPTYLTVRINLPNGNKIERINNLTLDLEKELFVYRENFERVVTKVTDEESASMRIEFNDDQSLTSFPYSLKNYLSVYASRIGGANISVYGYGPGFSSGLGGSSFQFRVEIKGSNFSKVEQIAKEYKDLISLNPRIDEIDINKSNRFWEENTFQLVGKINREKTNSYGFSNSGIVSRIASQTSGNQKRDYLYLGEEKIPYELKSADYKYVDVFDIEKTILTGQQGASSRIGDLVEFDRERVMSSIYRKNQQYTRNVTFNFKGPFKFGNEFVITSLKKMRLPDGYRMSKPEFSFFFAQENEVDVWLIILVAVMLMFMITSGLFESFKNPFIIISAIPFSIIGTIYLFYLFDYSLDRGAYAGILLLIGLSVNNSILLVDYVVGIKKATDINKIIQFSYERIRPISITTLTTIGALTPLLLTDGISFWKSLSLSVIGGIGLSSLMTVIVVPLLISISQLKSKINRF